MCHQSTMSTCNNSETNKQKLPLCLHFHLGDFGMFRWMLAQKVWGCKAFDLHRNLQILVLKYLCVHNQKLELIKRKRIVLDLHHLWSSFPFYDCILYFILNFPPLRKQHAYWMFPKDRKEWNTASRFHFCYSQVRNAD